MSAETNKELVRRFYETVEQEICEVFKDFCCKDFVFYPRVDTPSHGTEGKSIKSFV